MISSITPDQVVSETKAWATAIGAAVISIIAVAGTIYTAYQNSVLKTLAQRLIDKANLHDKQIDVNAQNIAKTATANDAVVSLVPMPQPPITPTAPIIPSQTSANQNK